MNALALRLRSFIPLRNFNEFFIFWVYFVQGSGVLLGIAEALILREKLGLDFAQMGLIGAASLIPWSIKPLYGLLTDLVPIGQFRRRPYLQIGAVIAAGGFAAVALFAHDFSSFLLPLIIANIGLGLTDVATDGFVVEETTVKNAARLQGLTQIGIRIAAFIGSFFSGLLIHRGLLAPEQMFLLYALFPLGTLAASFFIAEKPVDPQNEKIAHEILSARRITALLVIFVLLIANSVWRGVLADWLNLPSVAVTTVLWGSFFGWMAAYFWKLKKLKLTTSVIFFAMLFILLWRFNPGAGSPMFFYLKDTLLLSEETLGFVGTASQVASIIGIILAVKFFDRFPLKRILRWTVVVAGLFGISAFAITRPAWAEAIGSNTIVDWLATIIALPVYFFEAVFAAVTNGEWHAFWRTAAGLTPLENFLYLQSFIGELLFMLAYIPLFKLAVLICPRKAEATNFAVITAVMNIGLALSNYVSGISYEWLRDPLLAESAIDVSAIEILIWVNIVTSLTCLIVLPLIREQEVLRPRG